MSDQKVNIKLVEEIEKRPILYNFTLPGYSKKDETEKVWGEVAKEMRMTAAQCKERWRNLRAVFVRNMKLPKSGPGAQAKKAYYLLEAMQFTVPYIKALRMPSGNLPNPPQQEESEQSEEMYYENNAARQHSFSQSPSPSQQLTLSPTSPVPQDLEPSPSHIRKKKRAFRNDAVNKAYIDYRQAKKNRRLSSSDHVNQNPNTEALEMFFLSMLPDLLKMSDEEVRQFKRKTIDVVDDIFLTRSMILPQVALSSRSPTPSHCEMPLLPQTAHGVTTEVEGYYEAVDEALTGM